MIHKEKDREVLADRPVVDLGEIISSASRERWDAYFLKVCEAIASKSPCKSRQIGAILVRDKSIVATGYNGPPRGVPHCGPDRFWKDKELRRRFTTDGRIYETGNALHHSVSTYCPRQILGYQSGHGLEWCFAAHAERNCLINAARLGVTTLGTTLYMNNVIPCKDCLIELINAGVTNIVVEEAKPYNQIQFLLDTVELNIREFS